MTLGFRKLLVLGLVAGIFLLGHIWLVVSWLQEHGAVDLAQVICREYLTGTAITLIVAMLILLGRPREDQRRWLRRCSVCGHLLVRGGRYCSACGSTSL